MSSPGSILTLPSIQAALKLARHCRALGTIGVLTGGNGVGKTESLKFLARSPEIAPNQTAYYHQCVSAEGPSRGVRDILVGMEVRQAIHQRGMALPIAMKLALREIQDRKIGILLLDEADLLSIESLQGMVSLYDYCRTKEYPVAIIMAGARGAEKWIGALSAAWSRTLKVCRLTNLSVEMTAALFEGWGSPVADLSRAVRAKDRDAIAVLKSIHRGAGGNPRRLYFFAGLAAIEPKPLTAARVQELCEQMTTTDVVASR